MGLRPLIRSPSANAQAVDANALYTFFMQPFCAFASEVRPLVIVFLCHGSLLAPTCVHEDNVPLLDLVRVGFQVLAGNACIRRNAPEVNDYRFALEALNGHFINLLAFREEMEGRVQVGGGMGVHLKDFCRKAVLWVNGLIGHLCELIGGPSRTIVKYRL